MSSVTYITAARQRELVPIFSAQSFTLPRPHIGAQFKSRYSGAIVPDDVLVQDLKTQGQRIMVLHCYLPVDPDLTRVHRVLWQGRYGDRHADLLANPLELYVALTCLRYEHRDREAVIEKKVCDVLFPGVWGLLPYQKHIALWYKNKLLLPFEHGLVFCNDERVRRITETRAKQRT
jgi:hypothetical protein